MSLPSADSAANGLEPGGFDLEVAIVGSGFGGSGQPPTRIEK